MVAIYPVHIGDKVEFNTVDFVKVDKVDRLALAPYTRATKSTVLATKLNVYGNATVDFVADLLSVSATVDFQESRLC